MADGALPQAPLIESEGRAPPTGRGRLRAGNREEWRARLEKHAAIWRRRPLTREIYKHYHRRIGAALSRVDGVDLEIGAGHGSFAEFRPQTISSDVIPCPWLDCVADATHLPFADKTLANIIMIDVLHHVTDPAGFFAGAIRALAWGGRIVLIEPYVSPISWFAWRYFHEESIETGVNPFTSVPSASQCDDSDPWSANIAIPTLIFWRYLEMFHHRFPELTVIRRDRFDMLVMPLSGGFEKRRLIPMPLVPAAHWLERLLSPLARLMAFRCFIVIERTDSH